MTATTITGRTLRTDVDVQLMQSMGSDAAIVAAAKVSTKGAESAEDFDAEASAGLIDFLMKNRHGTPFEHNAMTFLISAPIFVFREFHRHRIGWSYNEESGRYKQLDPVFYVPGADRALVQVGKPGHYSYVPGTPDQHVDQVDRMVTAYQRRLRRIRGGVGGWRRPGGGTGRAPGGHVLVDVRHMQRPQPHGVPQPAHEAGGVEVPSFPQREIEMVAEKMEAAFAELFAITHAAFDRHGRVCP